MPKSEAKGNAEFEFRLTLHTENVLVLYREDWAVQMATCNYNN